MLCLTIPLILFTAPWCKEKLVVLPSHSYTVWWFLSFGCRRCGLAGSGSLSCHRPMPDTQNSPCAFLALSPSVAFTPTRVTLQLSFWRPGCILYYFPLFLLTLPCRPLSDTSSLSVLLHCVLVEEDLWAGSRHPKKYSSLFSFFPFFFFFFFTPPFPPSPWPRKNLEHGSFFFPSPSPPPPPLLWVSSPFFFFSSSPFVFFSFSTGSQYVFLWRLCCKGAWQVKPTNCAPPPPPRIQASLFRSVTVSCLSRKYILFSAMSPMSLVLLVSQSSPCLYFISKIPTLVSCFQLYWKIAVIVWINLIISDEVCSLQSKTEAKRITQ